MIIDEEERKKRLERARQISNSINARKNAVNNSNMYTNQEYINRFNRAREISNNINPRKNNTIRTVSQEELAKSEENGKFFMDLIDKNVNSDDSEKTTPIQETGISNKPIENKNEVNVNKLTPEQQKELQNKVKEASNVQAPNSKKTEISIINNQKEKKNWFQANELEDGYQFGDISKTILGTGTDIVQDLATGILSPIENVLDIGTNVVATVQNILGFKDAAKKTRNFADKNITQNVTSEVANASTVGILYNLVNGTPEKIINPAGITYDKDKNIVENYASGLNQFINETGEEQGYENSSVLGTNTDQVIELIGYTLGLSGIGGSLSAKTGTKTIGSSKLGANLSGGNIGLRLGGKTLNLPTLAIAGGMAGGLQEANSKPNVSEVERWTKGFTSGLTEGVTEGIFGFFGVGGNELTDELGKKIASKFTSKAAKMLTNLGFHASGEAIEEFLSYAGNFFADNAIIDNLGNADFSYEWNWADVGEQMLLAFLSTALTGSTAMIVDSNSATKSAEEQLGRKLTQEEKQLVTKAVVDESLNEQIEQMYQNEDIPQKLYVSTFNPDGTIANVEETRGKSINNPNKKVNVQPAIVKTGNDIYTVIDTETGLRLDTTPYNSMLAAEAGFNSKMINLKERDITAINKKVAMSDYSVRDVLLNTAYTIQNDIVQRRNTAQTFQNNNTDVQSNETQILSSQNDNAVKTNSDVSQTDMSITPDIIESNSELKQNVQTMATNFLDDLSNSTPGQRYKTGDTWTGQKRSTTKELAAIKDNTGASWNQISQSLEEISNGNITTPLSREIVTYIDSALTDGYRNIYGQDVLPSENYVNTKKSLGLYKETQKDSNYGVIDDEDARVFGEKIKRESNIKNQSSNYSDYKELIKNEEEKAISNFNPKVNIEIVEDVKNIKIKDLKQSEAIKIAKKVFNNNNKTKKFNNAELNLKIKVTSDDIKENIHKAFSNKSQKKYIKENISTFSNISSIILNGTKVSESTEQKSRAKYKGWNYFITHAMIDNRPFLIEFDVATQDDGLHFRVERLKEIKIKVDTPLATTKKSMPIQGKSTSINTSISQKNNSVKTNVNNNSIQKIQTLYRKFSRDFHENGYVDLNGRKVSDVKEVADIAQIFRNPNYETFRILYTKGDTIIGQEAVSSRIPGQSNIFKDNDKIKGFYNIKDRMKRLNADGYYMIHNHPSGNAVASQIDIKTTQNFSNRIPGFKAHIIVNSGTYAVIEREKGELSRLTTKNEITIENYKQDDIDKMMSSNPWSDIKIKSNQDIAKLMHDVKNNPNYSTLIMVDDKLFPRIILDIPNNFFSMKRSQIDGYIKNIAKQNGATRAFIATTNNDVYNSTNKLLTITDSILYSVKGNDIIQENTLSKNDENITKQKIFSNSDLRVKKVSTEALGAKAKRNIAIKEEQEKIKKELHNRIQNAILSRNSRKNTYLGNVSNAVVKKVKSLFGIDITNRTHLLADNDIRHMIKQHGNPEIETARGQIAITSKDIEKIPDILNNYDNIVKGTENKEGNTIRYIKKYSDNVSYVVEVIPTANDTTLYVKTMWKKAINNKKEAVALTNSNNTPSSTSKTRGNLASSNSIAQNNTNVKDNGVRAEKITSSKQTYRESAPYDERTHSDDKNFINNIKDNNYLKTLLSVDNSKGATNAQSSERLIEQEIELVESMGAFDNNIPVTKLTDIRKTIENYLGKKLLKGHFREHAYGIYKTKNDFIRVKELKDIDNILHEVGHALDLGQRVTINKETLQDELLKAVERHGGYENDTKTVQLEEGWAEVVRVYIINQSLAEKLYPKTSSFIDNVRQQDKSINDFLTRVQNQLYNYIHQNPRNRILSNMSIGEQTDKEPMTPEKFKKNVMRLIYDKDYLLKATVNDWAKMSGKKPSEIDPSRNAYILTRLASGVNNKAVSMISDGYIDVNGDKLMPGLNKLGEILNNDPQRFNDLRAYLVAKRDLEYKAKSLKTGIRTLDSKAVVKQFENDIQIQEAAQIVYDTLNGVLQYAVNNGLITQENADTIKESNTFYVPFHRVVTKNQVGRRGAVSEIIKGRTGSELDIKDVLENIVVNSANIIQQVENNNVLRALYEQGEELGMQNAIFDVIPTPVKHVGTATLSTWENELKKQGVDVDNINLEKTIDIFAPNNKIDQENRITSFIDTNGNRVYLQFTEQDIFNSIMGLDRETTSRVLKYLGKLGMPLRYGATMANIGFAIPNMISDTIQAAIYSEAGFIPVVDTVIGVLDILAAQNSTVRNFVNKYAPEYAKKIEYLYNIYQQSGASSSTRLSQYRKSSQEIMKDIFGTKNSEVLGIKESFKPLKRLLDIITYLPELSENSNRFRVFEKNYEAYKQKGGSETDARVKAAIESRDATQDFGRTGTVMREINKAIPFSAARVGSILTFSEKLTQNFKKTSFRIALLSVLTMLIKAIGYDDKEIEELNQRKKNDNFVLNIGRTIVTIKKPQGILRSILSLEEYTFDLATGKIDEGKEREKLVEWLRTALTDNLPADSLLAAASSIPLFGVLVENSANKDFYYNSDIVKSYDLDLPNEQQYYDYTSQLAILLGQIFHYSPAKIDNAISGWFGGLGTQVTNVIDYISGKLGLSVEEPAMGAEDNAIGKRFVVNVNENSASIDEVYTLKDELTKKLNGGTITSEENKQLEILKQATSDMAVLNKQIKAIKKDLTMSGTEKADKIRPLQEQKTDVARKALGKDPIYTTSTSDLDSLQFYPSRDVLSKNNYTLSLTEEMKKEYEKLAYSQYQKYKKQGIYSEEYLDKLKSKCKDYAKSKMMQKYKNKLTKSK